MKKKPWLEYEDPLEREISEYFRLPLEAPIENLELEEWYYNLVHFDEKYGVNFDGLDIYIYAVAYCRDDLLPHDLPPITVGHMVEVARRKQWFTPDYLKDYLTEEKQIELSVHHFVQSYRNKTVYLHSQINEANRISINEFLYGKLIDMLRYKSVKKIQYFNGEIYFVCGNSLRSRLMGERRIPLTVAHLVEVVKRKQWFDPEFKDELEKDIVGFFAGSLDATINIELGYHKGDWRKIQRYLEKNYSVDFTGMDADKYFVEKPLMPFCRPKPPDSLPPLTVDHMVEVVRRRKWFEPPHDTG